MTDWRLLSSSSPRSLISSNSGSPKSQRTLRRPISIWTIFTVGYMLGHLHGRLFVVRDAAAGMHQISSTDEHLPMHSPIINMTHDSQSGWNNIHVYYGPHAPVLLQEERWFSQAKQDELVIGLLRNKTNGYFIDLAANDAKVFSNTLALERYYNFHGLCIEPNPIYWYNLSTMRTNCQVVGAVVGNKTGDTVHFRFENGDHGGIVGFDNGLRWKSRAEERPTVTLYDIVKAVGQEDVPHVIDYLSLDVEGAEMYVLGNFPLDKYSFRIITAERLRGEIRAILKRNGYRFVQRLTRWGESLWINEAFESDLDLTVLDQYPFPLF